MLRRGGEILPGDTTVSTADRLLDAKIELNQAYWWLCGFAPWRAVRKDPPAQFVSVASDTVTVNSIVGATVTLSATIAATRAGRKFMLSSDGIPHRISAHTAGTDTLTLVTTYTGSATSGAGTIFQDEITVATDILSHPKIKSLHRSGEIRVISESEMTERFPINRVGSSYGDRYAAFINESTIRMVPWTSTAELFECAYNYRPDPLDFTGAGAGDTPILPRERRVAIPLRALVRLLTDKRDRVEQYRMVKTELDEILMEMGKQEATLSKPRSYVRPGARISG